MGEAVDVRRVAAEEGPQVDVEGQLVEQRLEVDARGGGGLVRAQEGQDVRDELAGGVGDEALKLLGAAEGGGQDPALPHGVGAAGLGAAEALDDADGGTDLGLDPRVRVLQDLVGDFGVCDHQLRIEAALPIVQALPSPVISQV